MKRFYKQAEAARSAAGWRILLDGRPVATPALNHLLVPAEPLARAMAEEWQAQGDTINPRDMVLTGLCNAAWDRVAPDRQAFADGLARYGESDLTCYRAEGPAALVSRQADCWDPLLAWARSRFDVEFEIVSGVMHRPQPERTVTRLARAISSHNAWTLAALSPIVTVSGSLVIALALAEEAVDLETAWTAATVDEAWQIEQWGEDAEAAKMLAARRSDFEAAYRFLTLLGSRPD